jgi:hypothetical protein
MLQQLLVGIVVMYVHNGVGQVLLIDASTAILIYVLTVSERRYVICQQL